MDPAGDKKTPERLADWRAAERDVAAARAAASIAGLALEAASAAEEAATEVEAAAKAALEAVDRARSAAQKARQAANQAAEAAALVMAGAKGDKVRANHDVEIAEEAERKARDAFHDTEREASERG